MAFFCTRSFEKRAAIALNYLSVGLHSLVATQTFENVEEVVLIGAVSGSRLNKMGGLTIVQKTFGFDRVGDGETGLPSASSSEEVEKEELLLAAEEIFDM